MISLVFEPAAVPAIHPGPELTAAAMVLQLIALVPGPPAVHVGPAIVLQRS